MDNRKAQRRSIVLGAAKVLQRGGPPLPSYGDIAEEIDVSRQLIRYYFDDPEDIMREVCDYLAEAYRMALVNGVAEMEGPKRLEFIFDFYFDLVEAQPKPRDDQTYDAVMAYAAGSEPIRTNLRGQYTLLGQVLQLEVKMQYPELDLHACAEIAYVFVCLMYGHWKMVASLGLSEDHKLISRRAIDRIIQSYLAQDVAPLGAVRLWETD